MIFSQIEKGISHGRWHFSFDSYYDPRFTHFGTLRVFNDDALSPGARWSLHRYSGIDDVTYCVDGELRYADENGAGHVLHRGWVQRTTIGIGMYHAEINNRVDESMQFIQMWFLPDERRLEPAVQQKHVERKDRRYRFLPLVSNEYDEALPIHSEAEVYSSFLQANHAVKFVIPENWSLYLYLLESKPVQVDWQRLETLGAAMVTNEKHLDVSSDSDAELLLVHVRLT